MYEESNNIKLDKYNENQTVWRYMDFTKFLSLLQYKALFFCTCLSMQNMDPFEGQYTKKNIEKLIDMKGQISLPHEYFSKPSMYRKIFLENVCINCWHANNTENAAMWKVYLSSNDGIAIKSTVEHIQKSFINNKDDIIYIGNINYKDYTNNDIPFDYNNYLKSVIDLAQKEKDSKDVTNSDILNRLCPYYFPLIMSKRQEFKFGKEVRLVSPVYQKTKNDRMQNGGKFVKTNLNILIDEIIISPNSPKWYVDLVTEVMDTYNLGNKKIYKSQIYEKISH